MKIAYITSSSFSGSTLLTFILNAHSEMCTISEFDIMSSIQRDPDYLCSCGEKIRECEHFLELKKQMNERGFDFELDDMKLMFNIFENERINRYFTQKIPLVNSTRLESFRNSVLKLVPQYNHFMDKMHKKNQAFMEIISKLQHANIFVDANKNPYRLKRLAERHTVFPIYLYKNGIGGVYSFYSKRHISNHAITFKEACDKWFLEQITINRVIKESNIKNVLSLSYSEMCTNTQDSLNKIFDLCHIEHESISDFNTKKHHIIGNVMRVKGVDKIEEKRDWLGNITEQELKVYQRAYNHYMPKLIKYNKEIEPNIWNGVADIL